MSKGLCYRCEYRAKYLEEKIAPRFECSQVNASFMSCYMYKPVQPLVIQKEKGDKRPLTLNVLSCRVVRQSDNKIKMKLKAKKINRKIIFYWIPYRAEKGK